MHKTHDTLLFRTKKIILPKYYKAGEYVDGKERWVK